MAALSYRDIIKKLKARDGLGSVYILFGEEDYTKADAVARFRKAASESGFPEFNLVRFSQGKLTLDDLAEAIETPPMMSELKLVEIDGADALSPKQKELEEYAKLLSFKEGFAAVVFHVNSREKTEKEITALLLKAPLFLQAMDIEEITIPVAGTYGSMTGMGGRSLFAADFTANAAILHEMFYGTDDAEGEEG